MAGYNAYAAIGTKLATKKPPKPPQAAGFTMLSKPAPPQVIKPVQPTPLPPADFMFDFGSNPDRSLSTGWQPPVQQQQPGNGGGSPYALLDSGYESDPMLQKIKALGRSDEAGADATALKAKRDALLAFGSRALAQKTLGDADPTLSAISDDPNASTSVLARIARGYKDTVKTTEDQLNEGNLWYGGYRGKVLGDLSRDRTTQEADATAAIENALQQIGEQLLGTKRQIRDRNLQAEDTAYQRWINRQLAYGTGGSGSGGGGGGGAGSLEWDPGAIDNVSAAGYNPDDVAAQINAYAAERGWTPHGVKQEGTAITQGGVEVKFDTPQGSNTVFVPISQPQPQQAAAVPPAFPTVAAPWIPTVAAPAVKQPVPPRRVGRMV